MVKIIAEVEEKIVGQVLAAIHPFNVKSLTLVDQDGDVVPIIPAEVK